MCKCVSVWVCVAVIMEESQLSRAAKMQHVAHSTTKKKDRKKEINPIDEVINTNSNPPNTPEE